MFHRLRYIFGEVAWVNAVARTFEPVRHRRDDDGNVIESVRANVDDTFLAVAGFENEALAQLLWSWACHGPALEIPGAPYFYGSAGCIRGNDLVDDKGNSTALVGHFEAGITAEERDRYFPHGLTDVFALNQLDWLQSIEQGADPETSGREGLYDLACAFGVLESSALQRPVTLNEMLTGVASTYQAEIDAHYGL